MMIAVGWGHPRAQDPAEIARLALLRSGAWGRFGKVAVISVVALFATGLYAAGRQVASPDALLTTFYGQVLAAKVALAVAIGLTGALNAALVRRWLGRRRAERSWLLALEATGGALALVAVALLTSSAPARGSEFERGSTPRSFMSTRVDDLLVALAVRPNEPGTNLAEVRVVNTRRPALAPVTGVSIRFSSPDGASATVDAVSDGGERYHLSGEQLGNPGAWTIDVVAHHEGRPDTTARFDWAVRDPAAVVREARFSTRALRGPMTAAALALIVTDAVIVLALLVGATVPRASAWWQRPPSAARARRVAE
jgi:hypothetical protein